MVARLHTLALFGRLAGCSVAGRVIEEPQHLGRDSVGPGLLGTVQRRVQDQEPAAGQQTGDALKTISHHVEAVNEHMGAIATSSQEQATGLSEVNTAVNQMDQTTQQNAALVQETTTATSALATESERLRALLEQFKLADHAQQGANRDGYMRMAG